MHNAVTVQVLEPAHELEHNLTHSVLSYVELSTLQVVKQICSLQILQHHEVIVWIFKQVDQRDYVHVLTHLQHLNLSPLLKDLNMAHLLFLYLFDSHFFACLFVCGSAHNTELALA